MRLTVEPITAIPTEIKLHSISRVLEISFDDGQSFLLPGEYLRVFTQSAEAVGHSFGQDILQTGKEDVAILDLQPVGNYGIKFVFSDGHDTGIYTWALLYKLGNENEALWDLYLQKLLDAGFKHSAIFKN